MTDFMAGVNVWDKGRDVLCALATMRRMRWIWSRNTPCKYINVRIDTRTGDCWITDRDDKRVSLARLLWQYSAATPDPPK